MPREKVALTEPETPPSISIEEVGDGFVVSIDGDTREVEPGVTEVTRLPSRPVVAETTNVTDEIVEIDDVPEYRWGPRTEFGEVTVEAIPEVLVTDHGALEVEN